MYPVSITLRGFRSKVFAIQEILLTANNLSCRVSWNKLNYLGKYVNLSNPIDYWLSQLIPINITDVEVALSVCSLNVATAETIKTKL